MWLTIRGLCVQGKASQGDVWNQTNKRSTLKQDVDAMHIYIYIYVKLGQDNRYYIASFVEEHNHGLVSPDKISFLRSNRIVSERARTTLFTCHKASIGTSQAYRLLQVSDDFDNIGCMKRDLQNYYPGLREKIKNEANSAFFYVFVVDEHGKLVYILWADATSRKNYSHFGDLVSFDATYSTNQYNMIFAPFTGVNHHMQSVFLELLS
jgi:hypothetical protein